MLYVLPIAAAASPSHLAPVRLDRASMPDVRPAQPGRADRIRSLLAAALAPAVLDVRDDSRQHAGHAGAAPGGETHYSVFVVSDRFSGQGRVARHRLVNSALAPEFAGGLHALALTLRTPEEQAALKG